mgnify:CR=1 FL=1
MASAQPAGPREDPWHRPASEPPLRRRGPQPGARAAPPLTRGDNGTYPVCDNDGSDAGSIGERDAGQPPGGCAIENEQKREKRKSKKYFIKGCIIVSAYTIEQSYMLLYNKG